MKQCKNEILIYLPYKNETISIYLNDEIQQVGTFVLLS